MKKWQWALLVVMIIAGRDCTCSQAIGGDEPDGGGMNGGLTVAPADITIDITVGGNIPMQAFTATQTMDGSDVSSQANWTVDDQTLGNFAGNTFTPSALHGGTTTVHAFYNGLSGTATLHVKLHANVTATTCPGCPAFPADGAPVCSGSSRNPAVLYPPDKTLVPPNMNVIELQFDQGTGNNLFEVDFENAATDVRVETRCNAITDTHSLTTNGCSYDLDQQVWDYIAQSNRGGDPLTITLRATDASGSCVAGSSSRTIIFTQEDLNGGIYYWQSVAIGGVQGKTGGIFRYDFGKRGQTPDVFLSPAAGGTTTKCVGCHFLSRDGAKMTYGSDDADADDEYSDLHAALIDVATKTVPVTNLPPGFQAFTPDHSLILASDGKATNNPPAFFLYDGSTGAAATPAKVPTGSARGTQPDFSASGASLVYVQPTGFLLTNGSTSTTSGDDSHFFGGSLYTMSFDATSKAFGTPAALLTSTGENNYYPGYSPDNNYVVFNRVPGTGTQLSQDAFSNINARVMLLAAHAGATPIDLPALNDNGALTNSWPRFAPVVQMYKGHKLVWVTFSSTRDYGDRVRNSIQVDNGTGTITNQVNCYPGESPENPNGSKTQPLAPNCHQPQLWMAAIDLTTADSGSGDPSYPAFWLPFQDVNSHNHIAQWVITIVGNSGGTCKALGTACAAGDTCCGSVCTSGTCTIP